MSAAILDLRPQDQRDKEALATAIVQAEQGFLGCALYERGVVDAVEGLEPEHFLQDIHGRIWEVIRDFARKGLYGDPVSVGNRLENDPGMIEAGGMRYLADLVDHAPPTPNATTYATQIIDQAKRRRLLNLTGNANHHLITGGDVAEAIEELETELLVIQRSSKRVAVVSADAAVRAMLADLSATDDEAGGVLTGIEAMDSHLGRLQPDELILIAGRPGAGKSALAACIALNMARAGLGVIEINSEMSVAQMMRRHVSDLCHLKFGSNAPTYKDIKRRDLKAQQWQMIEWAAGELRDLPLAMVKKTGLTLSALRSLVRRQTAVWAGQGITLGAIAVDHVGLLQADGGGRDRYTDQTNIAIGMKVLADELHVPVIALVQLSRKVEDRDNKRPQLSDLRDSGAWEENADIAIGVYREAYYANKQAEPKDDGRRGSKADLDRDDWDRARKSKAVEAIIMKVREGEETTINLWASIGHNAIRSSDPNQGGMF